MIDMADDDNTEPIRTTMDIELEKLSARLDALETENRELRSANQGLWAQLHPVAETVESVQPVPEDGAFRIVAERLGLEE